MAIVRASIFSGCLMRTVPITAIIPADKADFSGKLTEKKPYKTLYLLHGIFGDENDWINGTRIARWAQDANLAVIMPAGENHFYTDCDNSGERYGEFIGRELVELTRRLFPLSDKREDTFIGGLSMGGCGAFFNGLRYHDTFGAICALSSALILNEQVYQSDDSAPIFPFRRTFYEELFGNLDKLAGSRKDYKGLVDLLIAEKGEFPKIYMCVGTEDTLLETNRDFHKYLIDRGVEVTYEEGPGAHTWDFWDTYIKKVIDWLPLDEKTEGVSSGHVGV